jgi:predicted transcriptional regulator
MKKLLLEVIFASEKRKEVLLLLEDGAREMEDILNTLDTTRQALLPQMRILEEHYLVSHLKDRYRLTSIGKLLVDNIRPLVNTLDFFETDIDYWGTHKLEFIPSHLLKRLNQLKHVTIIVPNTPFAFEMNRLFFEYIEKSKSLISVTSYLRDDFIQHFPRLIKNGIEMSYIINSELLEKLKENDNEYFRNCVKDGNMAL